MKTATIQIGNSDDKLLQHQWSHFCDRVGDTVRRYASEIHFRGFAPSDAPWQNAAWVIAIDEDALARLRAELSVDALGFRQDSIALTVGDTEFVAARGVA